MDRSVGYIPKEDWWYPQCDCSLHPNYCWSCHCPYHGSGSWKGTSTVDYTYPQYGYSCIVFSRRLAEPWQPILGNLKALLSLVVALLACKRCVRLRIYRSWRKLSLIFWKRWMEHNMIGSCWIILFFSCRKWFGSSCSFNSHDESTTLTSTFRSNIYCSSIVYEIWTLVNLIETMDPTWMLNTV